MSMDNLESLKIMQSSFDTVQDSVLPVSEKENNQSENMVCLGDDEENKEEVQSVLNAVIVTKWLDNS